MGLINNLISHTSAHPSPGRLSAGVRYAARFLLVAGGYYLAARLFQSFAIAPGIISPFWPPAAIGVYACLAWGMRMAPALWLGATLAVLPSGLPLAAAMATGIGPGIEACAAAFLLQHRYRAGPGFVFQGNVFPFIGITLAACAIGASLGVAGLAWWAAPLSMAVLMRDWLTWWLGDATGILVGVPTILAWNMFSGVTWKPATIMETVAFWLLLPAVTQLAFGDTFGTAPIAYTPIPFLLWAAFRFNLPTTCWATFVICVIATWNTAHGHGPFARSDLNTPLFLVFYNSIISTTSLALASAIHQRGIAESKLRIERNNLEERVRQRTDALVADIEKRKRIEEELALRERQLSEAQQVAQMGSWNWDIDSNTITWSDELYRIYGRSKHSFDLTPENCRALIHPDDLDALSRAVRHSRETGMPFATEHRILLPDGAIRIVSAHGQLATDSDGRVKRMYGTLQDVTEARIAEASLREAEERYRMVVELSPDAVLVQQDDVFVFANPAAVAMLRADNPDRLLGHSLFEFLHPDFHEMARERIARLRKSQTLPSVEQKYVRLDGDIVDVEVTSAPFLHKGRFASLFIMRDITERKKTIEQMAYLAHYDSLTGLPNRTLFHQRLEHALNIAERPGRSLEILFLDLDRFKSINDTLGHATGDLVLKETASRLQSILRESDTVARLGGDEFVVLVENVDEPHRGGIIADKILSAFAPPFLCDKNPLLISTSIGISSFPTDGTDAETLLKKADIAMYRAKESGRDNYRYFSSEMNVHTAERLMLEYALNQALSQNQLSLYYQPKIDVETNRITGMEALLRWQHPTIGAVSPRQFIPLAEETGLIKPIGYWAIRAACMQNKYWQDISAARLKVAVNLSQRQLADEGLVQNIGRILDETELDPRYLELEITENAVIANPEKTLHVLDNLCDMGISVVIDDFGIGYSSLSYLKHFPVRAVKIDRSFMQGIPFDQGDSAIAKAIISLAHGLDCSVIAEGAETQQQYDFLRANACDSVQGYYFSEPMPAEHFEDLIKVQSNLHMH